MTVVHKLGTVTLQSGEEVSIWIPLSYSQDQENARLQDVYNKYPSKADFDNAPENSEYFRNTEFDDDSKNDFDSDNT